MSVSITLYSLSPGEGQADIGSYSCLIPVCPVYFPVDIQYLLCLSYLNFSCNYPLRLISEPENVNPDSSINQGILLNRLP